MKKHKHKLLTISILVTLTSAAIFVINKLIAASAVIKNLLHGKSENYYDWKFGKIHYTVRGTGSPLLLVHDLHPCCSTAEWKLLADSLAKKHTVYCIDLLGCGCSDRPKMTYTNFLYVQLITDFIKKVIKERTDIVTSGLSGSFAIMACRCDESVINRILMINPEDLATLNQIPTKQSKIAKFLLELPLVGTLVYNVIMARGNIDLYFTEHYLYNPFHMDTELVDSYFESAHLDQGNGKYLLASLKGKYVYCNIAQALKSINNSIYIIQGESEVRAKESAALYCSLNPSVECEIFSHAKHLPHIELPKKVLSTMDMFFD
ncbi:MAG: alpha/beta fold hydrolase [Clostridiales bacterium]|nr:alpha/beta fold hydrolase [Clostridiales bacterium]